jgi:hypothetical protein
MSSGEDELSAELLSRYRAGDERAATELFQRYVERLTLLARSRLSPRLAVRADPEDIVLSAYRSFFVGVREGRFWLQRSGDLWRLLVSITLHKLYHQAQRHTAEMRSIAAEQPLNEIGGQWTPLADRQPTPEEAALIALAEMNHQLQRQQVGASWNCGCKGHSSPKLPAKRGVRNGRCGGRWSGFASC